jgi:hypothetical protein
MRSRQRVLTWLPRRRTFYYAEAAIILRLGPFFCFGLLTGQPPRVPVKFGGVKDVSAEDQELAAGWIPNRS